MLKIKKIKPVATGIVTTANRYKQDSTAGLIIDTKKLEGDIKEYQKVLAVGAMVREVQVGDTIIINPKRYVHKRNKITNDENDNSIRNEIVSQELYVELPVVELYDGECLMLDNQDVGYILEDFEEDEENNTLVLPEKPKIILK